MEGIVARCATTRSIYRRIDHSVCVESGKSEETIWAALSQTGLIAEMNIEGASETGRYCTEATANILNHFLDARD